MALLKNGIYYPGNEHPVMRLWQGESSIFSSIQALLQERNVPNPRCLVLLPFAQQLHIVKQAWLHTFPQALSPRFETTESLAKALGGSPLAPEDVQINAMPDILTIKAMLAITNIDDTDNAISSLILQIAWQLAPIVAAIPPNQRHAWASDVAQWAEEDFSETFFSAEKKAILLAISWLGQSGFSTDILFHANTAACADLVIKIRSLEFDPFEAALQKIFQSRFATLDLLNTAQQIYSSHHSIAFHEAQDIHDEIKKATAKVIAHIKANQSPVALVSMNRASTRLAIPFLKAANIRIRDENGWKLSTTLAGGKIATLLKVIHPKASLQNVITCLCALPAFANERATIEHTLRKKKIQTISDFVNFAQEPSLATFSVELQRIRTAAYARKTLKAWMAWFIQVLEDTQLLNDLQNSDDGRSVIDAFHLNTNDLEYPESTLAFFSMPALWQNTTLLFDEFSEWILNTLETSVFKPTYPEREQVAILPMNQMLGRPFAAVVLMGCDEVNLGTSSDLGFWTRQMRSRLGLPSREQLQDSIRKIWENALVAPIVDIFWHTKEISGEVISASSFVIHTKNNHPAISNNSCSLIARYLHAAPVTEPSPSGAELLPKTISASSYEDLRSCPYRFFALRLLNLREEDELEQEAGKREYGTWLHALLHEFHEQVKGKILTDEESVSVIDLVAKSVMQRHRLLPEDFLPFEIQWPALRDAYLQWLKHHQTEGFSYAKGELFLQRDFVKWQINGRIDRIDHTPSGDLLVIDYKTGDINKIKEKITAALEDTQMLFYAFLLQKSELQTTYLKLNSSGEVSPFQHPITSEEIECFQEGLLNDLMHIAHDKPLLALGEGATCAHCNARGLCRKDMWITRSHT